MTQIQDEIARLQVMVDVLASELPDSENADRLAQTLVPNLDALRAKAEREMDEGTLSSETFNAVSDLMGAGEDTAWSIERVAQTMQSKLVCRQFDNIHIMMNALEGLPVPEGHKEWPP